MTGPRCARCSPRSTIRRRAGGHWRSGLRGRGIVRRGVGGCRGGGPRRAASRKGSRALRVFGERGGNAPGAVLGTALQAEQFLRRPPPRSSPLVLQTGQRPVYPVPSPKNRRPQKPSALVGDG